MAEHRYTSHLKNELGKEEALLKSIKDKLVDQLQRLKVEELALVNYLSVSNNPSNLSQTASSTGTYFNTNMQDSTNNQESEINNEEINSVPLCDLSEGLASNSLILNDQEDEQEDDED